MLKEKIEGECQTPTPESIPKPQPQARAFEDQNVESCGIFCSEDFTCESYLYVYATKKCETFPFKWFNCTAIIGTLEATKCDNSKIFYTILFRLNTIAPNNIKNC